MSDRFKVQKIIGSDAIDRLEFILEELYLRHYFIINVLPVGNDGSLAVIATRAKPDK